MSDLTTVSCATQSLVKCFSNSVLGVNLTTILIDMEPWFIAKEVATLLGYTNASKAIGDHVDELDQKMLSRSECEILFNQNIIDSETLENTDDLKGTEMVPLENTDDFKSNDSLLLENPINVTNRGMKFINESGLYTLIARSNKPEARRFQRWVTSEVLPSIRKTGQYIIQKQTPSYAIEDPIERAKAWISEQEEKRALEDKTKALEVEKRQLEADNENLTQERDKAIATKHQISTNREAVAVGRVGGLVTANNRLKDELYGNRNRRTIKAVAIANHLKDKDINYYALIKYCKEHNLEIIKVPDTNWNEVNSYPIEAFKAVYPELIID